MIAAEHPLPIARQCQLLALPRSSVYYTPQPVSPEDLARMRELDALHLAYPFAGSRLLRDLLRLRGVIVGRKHVATLMRRMGIEALSRHPRTAAPGAPGVSLSAARSGDHVAEPGLGDGSQCAAVKHHRR